MSLSDETEQSLPQSNKRLSPEATVTSTLPKLPRLSKETGLSKGNAQNVDSPNGGNQQKVTTIIRSGSSVSVPAEVIIMNYKPTTSQPAYRQPSAKITHSQMNMMNNSMPGNFTRSVQSIFNANNLSSKQQNLTPQFQSKTRPANFSPSASTPNVGQSSLYQPKKAFSTSPVTQSNVKPSVVTQKPAPLDLSCQQVKRPTTMSVSVANQPNPALKKVQPVKKNPRHVFTPNLASARRKVDSSINQPVKNQPVRNQPKKKPMPLRQLVSTTGPKLVWHNNSKEFDNDLLLEKSIRERMYKTLKGVFGLKEFRFSQRAIVVASLLQHDCCVLMPTGAGKSLCYQLPAVITNGLTIIISPLVSLMVDQTMKMRKLDIKCACFKGDTPQEERDRILYDLGLDEPQTKMLYVSPEMINNSADMQKAVNTLHSKNLISRIVIDEAHCITSWGKEFRPDYIGMVSYVKNLCDPRVPITALTATGTPESIKEIHKLFGIESMKMFVNGFGRPNIQYNILQGTHKDFLNSMEFLDERFPNETGIVYCLSKKDCENVARELNRMGFSATPYHAGLDIDVKNQTQMEWMRGRIKIVCATVAFGMGVDKPDVRFVVHHSMASSYENYYQQTGRAGRDGKPSVAIMVYAHSDQDSWRNLFSNSEKESRESQTNAMLKFAEFCKNNTECRRVQLLRVFGETYTSEQCVNTPMPCDICSGCSYNGLPIEKVQDQRRDVITSIHESFLWD